MVHYVNPLILLELSSGSKIILTITWKLRIILQIIGSRVVGGVLINIFPSNIFQISLLLERFHQNYKAGFGRCEH